MLHEHRSQGRRFYLFEGNPREQIHITGIALFQESPNLCRNCLFVRRRDVNGRVRDVMLKDFIQIRRQLLFVVNHVHKKSRCQLFQIGCTGSFCFFRRRFGDQTAGDLSHRRL